nr:hypothetical protein Iba_chr14dCG11890 [Ipomoea batatas]
MSHIKCSGRIWHLDGPKDTNNSRDTPFKGKLNLSFIAFISSEKQQEIIMMSGAEAEAEVYKKLGRFYRKHTPQPVSNAVRTTPLSIGITEAS